MTMRMMMSRILTRDEEPEEADEECEKLEEQQEYEEQERCI